MKYVVLVSILLIASCGYDIDCNHSFWAGGITFCYQAPFDSPPDTQMVEEIVADIEYVSNTFYSHIGGLRQVLQDVNTVVYVTMGDLREDCMEAPSSDYQLCYSDMGGYNSSDDGLIVIEEPGVNNTCLLRGVFMHEVLHTVDHAFLGGSGHSTPYFFVQTYENEADKQNTIEWKLWEVLESKIPNYPLNCQ